MIENKLNDLIQDFEEKKNICDNMMKDHPDLKEIVKGLKAQKTVWEYVINKLKEIT